MLLASVSRPHSTAPVQGELSCSAHEGLGIPLAYPWHHKPWAWHTLGLRDALPLMLTMLCHPCPMLCDALRPRPTPALPCLLSTCLSYSLLSWSAGSPTPTPTDPHRRRLVVPPPRLPQGLPQALPEVSPLPSALPEVTRGWCWLIVTVIDVLHDCFTSIEPPCRRLSHELWQCHRWCWLTGHVVQASDPLQTFLTPGATLGSLSTLAHRDPHTNPVVLRLNAECAPGCGARQWHGRS